MVTIENKTTFQLASQKSYVLVEPSGVADPDIPFNDVGVKSLTEDVQELDQKESSLSSAKSPQEVLDKGELVKLKTMLEKVVKIQDEKKKWFRFQEMIEERHLENEDPTPNLVEGIFFVKVSNWTNIARCRKPAFQIKICIYDARSFYLFDHKTWLRKFVVKFTESTEFQNFSLAIILMTTLTLIIYNYQDPDSVTLYNQLLDKINTYSTYFYIFEFLLQLITKGVFLHRNSYFRDGWNWLDFLVVLAGLTEMTNIPNLPIKGFRALRVLRPLKSIRQFPRLRKLISGLLSSIPQLLNALFFMLFCFLQYSIFGSQQFGGVNYSRCRLPGGVVEGVWPIDQTQMSLCSKTGDGYTCQGDTVCGEPHDVGLNYHSDHPQAYMSSFNDYGISNFNDPIQSLVTIFQCITLEGWSNLMFNLQSQQSGIVVVIFFVLVVILGAFFLIHVILAVVGYSLQQNDMNVTSEINKEKDQIAMSFKRKEAQLQIDQKAQFQEQVRQQFQEQELQDQIWKDEDQATQQQEQQENVVNVQQTELLTERGLLPATESEAQEAQLQGALYSRQISQVSRQSFTSKVVPQEMVLNIVNKQYLQRDQFQFPARTQKNKVYLFFYKICISPYFTIIMTLIIVANAATMALERYPQPDSFTTTMFNLNQMFSWIFTLEMIIKVTGLGVREYVRDSFNIFDAAIVILSLVDNILQYSVGNSASGGGVIVLRSIRLLRVFKLARNWTSLRILIVKIVDTLPNLASFAFLLFIFQVVFVILGLQFFAGAVYLDANDQIVAASQGDPPLNNFNNIYNASTTVFAVMMTDNWNQMMYQYYRGMGVQAMIYFIGTIITLNIVLLNLFLALFLESFENPTAITDSENDQELTGFSQFQEKLFRYATAIINRIPQAIERKFALLDNLGKLESYFSKKVEESEQDSDESQDLIYQKSLRRLGSVHIFEKQICQDWKLSETDQKTQQRKYLLSIAQLVKKETLVEIVKKQEKKEVKATGVSLWFLTPESLTRRVCLYIFNLAHFENFSNVMVLFSTVLLTIDNPLDDPLSKKQFALTILDYITTAIFSFEALIKIVVFGVLFNGKSSYLREPWNFLDLFVVMISLFSYLPLGFDMQFYKSMRLLRILRPLRMIQRNQGLKIAIKSLFNVLPGVINLLMISGINLGLLAVLGTNLFKGTFYSCNLQNVPQNVKSKIRNTWECQDYGGEWINSDQNFDNFLSSCSAVFQIMTTEGWYELATQAQMSTNILQMPSPMASPVTFAYFVIVIFIQSLFMGNLFIGVVITTFRQEKERLSNNTHLTALEYEYIDTCIKCFKLQPQKVFTQKDLIRKICYQITDSKVFKNFILVCISANTILLACTWYGQSDITINRIEYFNLAFSIVYFLEFILKVIALRTEYFQDGWNQLDFFIVLAVTAGYAVRYLSDSSVMIGIAVVRIFRVTRLLKLVRQLKLLRRCFQTFTESAPEIVNIGSLLVLFLFMFSILSMNLFASVKLQTNLSQQVNFQTFWTAFLSLFITCTGENWPFLLADVSRQRSITFQCLESQSYLDVKINGIRGCGEPLGKAFFPVFQTFMSFVMLNLFSAIIIEGFQRELLDELQKIRQETLEMFQNLWKKYDPDATGMIAIEDLPSFLLDFVDQETKINDKIPIEKQRISDEIFFNFRHKKLLTLSAKWRKKQDDGSQDYYNLKNSQFFQKELQSHLQKFIGELQIPSYKRFQYYNFHDVINGFVNFSFTQRRRHEYFQRKNMIARLKETKQTLSKLDSIEIFSEKFYNLSRIEKEQLMELESENFINVIHNIERKGKRLDKQILKLKLMQELRRRNALQNKDSLDQIDGQVVSSKLLDAAKTINIFVANWRVKNNLKKKRTQLIQFQLREVMKSPQKKSELGSVIKSQSDVSPGKSPQSETPPKVLLPAVENLVIFSDELSPFASKHALDSKFQASEQTQAMKAVKLRQSFSQEIIRKPASKQITKNQSWRVKFPHKKLAPPKQVSMPKSPSREKEVKLVKRSSENLMPKQSIDNFKQAVEQCLSEEVKTDQDAPFCSPAVRSNKFFPAIISPISEVFTLELDNQDAQLRLRMRPMSQSVDRPPVVAKKQNQKLLPTILVSPIRHRSQLVQPKINSANGQIKLQSLPRNVIRQATIEIYTKKKLNKKVSQEKLHRKILKVQNHKPWQRFSKETGESDVKSPQSKSLRTQKQAQSSQETILQVKLQKSKSVIRTSSKPPLPPMRFKQAFFEQTSIEQRSVNSENQHQINIDVNSRKVTKVEMPNRLLYL